MIILFKTCTLFGSSGNKVFMFIYSWGPFTRGLFSKDSWGGMGPGRSNNRRNVFF